MVGSEARSRLQDTRLPLSQLPIERLEIRDMLIVQPQRFGDERGYFVETYSQFAEIRIDAAFIQDNQSLSLLAGTVGGRPQARIAELRPLVRHQADCRPGESRSSSARFR